MDDNTSSQNALFTHKSGLPLVFYLPPDALDSADASALRKDIIDHGGTLCESMPDADLILADASHSNILSSVSRGQVVLNKNWVRLCVIAGTVLGAEVNWAKQALPEQQHCDTQVKSERPSLSISTAMDKPTLPGIHALGLARDDGVVASSCDRERRNDSPYALQPCQRANSFSPDHSFPKLPDPRSFPNERITTISVSREPCIQRSPYSSRAYELSEMRNDDRTTPTARDEDYDRVEPFWGRQDEPLYSRPRFARSASETRPRYIDREWDYSNYYYSHRSREEDYHTEEAFRRNPPPPPSRIPHNYPDTRREPPGYSLEFDRPMEEAYYGHSRRYDTRDRERERERDRATPPWKGSPRSYAHLSRETFAQSPVPPPSYSSSSPEERPLPATPERGSDLRVVQYDPTRFELNEKPTQRVYRGGYPVASKAIGMKEPTYTMPDGRIWTIDDDEPPPKPDSPPRKNGSKRHNQYSEAEDWFLVHYANWMMRKNPRMEMKELYQKLHEQMDNHTSLALYLRVNKSREYFRKLGMTERALSRRVQMPSRRTRAEWDDELVAMRDLSIRERR